MNRRSFVSSLASGGISLSAPSWLQSLEPDNRHRKEIGIQIYTLRNQLKRDLEGTLQEVKDAGYFQVEPYGFPDRPQVNKVARDCGLEVRSTHFNWDSVVNPGDKGIPPFESILEQALEERIFHLVVPYLTERNRKTLDDYRQVAENCNKGAELAREAGIQLAYHNHAFEFEPHADGTCGYDIFIQEFSLDMKFEMDVFWVKAGGKDPAELIGQLGNRVSQLHLKDLAKGQSVPAYHDIPENAFEELGDGQIPMEPILEAAKKAQVEYCHVEQDYSPDPVASIRQSAEYLRSL